MYTKLDKFDYKIKDNEIHIKRCHSRDGIIDIASEYTIDGKKYPVTKILNERTFFPGISEIRLPKTLVHISAQAIDSAAGIEKFIVDPENEKYSSKDGVLFNKTKTTLIKVPQKANIKKLDLTGVTSIKENACYFCESLEEVILDEKIKELRAQTFYGCEKLRIINLPKNLTGIGRHCFHGCKSLQIEKLPEKLKSIAAASFMCCTNLKKITMPNTVELLGTKAFEGCFNLKSINISKNIKYIHEYTFGQTDLENLMLMHDIKISPLAFQCAKVKNLYLNQLPNNMKIEDIVPVFPLVKNIFLLNDEVLKKYPALIETYKINGINFHTIKNVEKLEEEGYEFAQINQIINGYEKNLILTNIPPSISSDIFRDLIKCWRIDKERTFEIITMLSNPGRLENTIDIFNKINDIQKIEKKTNTKTKEER